MRPSKSFMQRGKQQIYRMLPYLKNIGLESGLLPGHTDYTRFIILGRSRSGSNFLRGLLNEHRQVMVFGELFQNFEAFDWAMPGFRQTQRLLRLIQQDPVAFLEKKVFKRYPPVIGAVGFKIFYYHAQQDSRKVVWPHLLADEALRVIHIKRRNILKTHLSRQRALLTDTWVDTAGEKVEPPPITLDYETCLEDFNQTRTWEAEFDRLFQKHPTIQVAYEDLARSYTAEMSRIQDFLGVDLQQVSPQTRKQASQPLSTAIANFADLKKRFAGTPWEEFFIQS